MYGEEVSKLVKVFALVKDSSNVNLEPDIRRPRDTYKLLLNCMNKRSASILFHLIFSFR